MQHIMVRGVTLIELITLVSITSTLLLIGVPSFVDISDKIRADTNIRRIQQTLTFARNTAINLGSRVTVCPLVNNRCNSNWQGGFSVFIDNGTSEVFDSEDTLISILNDFDSKDFLQHNRDAVKFQPDGLAFGSNGTLIYCPRLKESAHARALVINQAGRVRFSTAKNIKCV